MNIAILCHAGVGGSGIVATELAIALSECGFNVHIIGEQRPFRLALVENRVQSDLAPVRYVDLGETPSPRSFWGQAVSLMKRSLQGRFRASPAVEARKGSLHFHEVQVCAYPLFEDGSLMVLQMANTLASVISRYQIQLVHAHYAIPHSTSAILAREGGLPIKVITTLHGTDVTTVGGDPAFQFSTRHALTSSDAVTAVSNSLISSARTLLGVEREILHIPNWVDARRFARTLDPSIRKKFAQPEEALILHASNFRPVKQSTNVIRIFAEICKHLPARLFLVGDGPEKASCIDLAVELGISGRVLSLPPMVEIERLLGLADVVLLPSSMEAFPLVALEAMAAGAIVIASDVGGLPELITSGVTGFLHSSSDISGMADNAVSILRDEQEKVRIQLAAREEVLAKYQPEVIIQRYLSTYRMALGSSSEFLFEDDAHLPNCQ